MVNQSASESIESVIVSMTLWWPDHQLPSPTVPLAHLPRLDESNLQFSISRAGANYDKRHTKGETRTMNRAINAMQERKQQINRKQR